MTRRPPDPDTPVRGRAIPVAESLRPEGPVAETAIIDRVAFADALVRMEQLYDDPQKAHAALMRLALSGQVPITCRELIYTAPTGRDLVRYSWPGEGAKLADQLAAASRINIALFRFDPVMGDAQWLDLLGRPAAKASAYGLHVDGIALTAVLPASAPPPRAMSTGRRTIAGKGRGRPSKRHRALVIFLERLEAGNVLSKKSNEARAIAKEWGASDAAAPDTIADQYIKQYHAGLEWSADNTVTNAAVIIAAVQADLIREDPI